jgi:uncharacterized protein (UPF0147 family)
MDKTMTIRPGLLLGLKTSVKGGVKYKRLDLPAEDGQERWETTKTVDDKEELERAQKLRSKVGNSIRAVCAQTSFGLLCPNEREADLDAALIRARDEITAHNRDAQYTRVDVWCIKGRIAENDVVAAKAIASDVADLISEMDKGIKDADVETVRRAATQAKQMLGILSEEKQRFASQAIDAAREAARAIVARVQKKGEELTKVLAEVDSTALTAARLAFLDMETDAPTAVAATMPGTEMQRFASVDDGEMW